MQASEGIEVANKLQTVQNRAQELFNNAESDWSTFFREILGVNGIVHKLYPDPASLAAFEQTQEYADLQLMLAKLRDRNGQRAPLQEVTRVITVRLPKSLHESLKSEAYARRTSMNQLCISKLLQTVEEAAAAGEENEEVQFVSE